MKNADLWPIILTIFSPFFSYLFLSDGYDAFGSFFSSFYLFLQQLFSYDFFLSIYLSHIGSVFLI